MNWKKTTLITVICALVLAAGVYSMYEYYQGKLETMRTASVQELRSSVVLSDYGEKEQQKINEILDSSEQQILASKQQYEIDQITSQAESEIEDIPTLKQMRREGKAELMALVNLDHYRDAEKQEIKKILKKYRKKINKKTKRKQIKKLIKKAKKEIGEIKTDEELTAEEEAAREAELERQRIAAEKARKEKEEREKAEKEAAKQKQQQQTPTQKPNN